MYGILLLSFLGDFWQHNPGPTCPSLPSATVTCSSFTHKTDVNSPIVQPSLMIDRCQFSDCSAVIDDWLTDVNSSSLCLWWMFDMCQFMYFWQVSVCQLKTAWHESGILLNFLIYISRRYLFIVKICIRNIIRYMQGQLFPSLNCRSVLNVKCDSAWYHLIPPDTEELTKR